MQKYGSFVRRHIDVASAGGHFEVEHEHGVRSVVVKVAVYIVHHLRQRGKVHGSPIDERLGGKCLRWNEGTLAFVN